MKNVLLVIAITVGLVVVGSVSAKPKDKDGDVAELTKQVSELDAVSAAGQQQVLERISTETGVPVETLKMQKSQTGLGYGGLCVANLLAKATGKTFEQIVTEFKSGKGWGEIAKENGVKLGELVSAAHRAAHASDHPPVGGQGKGKGRGRGHGKH